MRLRSWCAVVALFVATISVVDATTIRNASFAEYCACATQIVRGVVTQQQGTIPKSGIARTLVTLRVNETFKGDAAKELTVFVPGAVTPDSTVFVAGAPRFVDGEEIVAFVESTKAGHLLFLGLSGGVYRLTLDTKRGSIVSGLHADPAGVDLGDFRKRIEAELASATKPAGK